MDLIAVIHLIRFYCMTREPTVLLLHVRKRKDIVLCCMGGYGQVLLRVEQGFEEIGRLGEGGFEKAAVFSVGASLGAQNLIGL